MIKVFEFIIDENDPEFGMSAISIVDKPAIESEFIAFEATNKPKFIRFQDEVKRIVSGLALIPNKLIYRVDEYGEEYLGYFSPDTVEAIMNKFMNEAQKGSTKNVNLQHSDYFVEAHLIESFILRTPEMVDAVKAMGIEEAVLGSWFVSYKFDNIDDYNEVVNNNFTGFSIEIFLSRELKLNKNKSKNNLMKKINKFIDKFKSILNEFEIAELEDVVIADGTGTLRIGDVGTPVLKVIVAEDGTETTENVPAGEYITDAGTTIVVDEQGNLLEVKDVVAPQSADPNAPAVDPATLDDEGLKDKDKKMADEPTLPLAEGDPMMPEDPAMPEAAPTVDVASKKISEIVDVAKDGEYYIVVKVQGGQIVEAEVSVEQNLISSTELQAVKTENDELKLKLAKPIAKPIFEFSEPKVETKIDKSKMNNLELTIHRLGL